MSGEGGRLYSGRWHTAGRPIIYTAENPAQAILEVRVNLDLPYDLIPADYVLMAADTGGVFMEAIDTMPPAPSAAGDAWLTQRRSACLRVPAAVVPRGFNVLINPLHPDAAGITVLEIEDFKFDPRLWPSYSNPRKD